MTTPLLLAMAALLAQADPGPGPAETPPPATAKPVAPAASGPAEQAPPEDKPASTSPSPSPSPTSPSAPDAERRSSPPNAVAIFGGAAYRLTSTALGPSTGFSIGGSFQHRYATVGSVIELGWNVDFFFDRFSTGVVGSAPDASGVEQTYAATRTITATMFEALQTLGVRDDAFHFWLGGGGGLSIGFFSSPELALRPGTANAYQPFARAAAGVDVAINDQASVGLRAGYAFMLTSSALKTDRSGSIPFMGDLLDIQAGLFYRFR